VTTILLPGPHDLFQLLLNDNRDILIRFANREVQLSTLLALKWRDEIEQAVDNIRLGIVPREEAVKG
jgi:hypothetical protein